MISGIIVSCAILVAGWFAFDGARALTAGDYITPKSGKFAGQLGPWSKVVRAIGIEPRSFGMKLRFLLFGVIWLAVIVCFLLGLTWSWFGMLGAATLSLWYLPFGALLGVIQIVLLLVQRLRT